VTVAVQPSITDWISALSTAALGVLGVVITVWQWRRTGFAPRLTSRIDTSREGIELLVVNKGRAAGIIDQVDVVGSGDEVIDDAVYEGFSDGRFRPLALPAMASMRIIIQAPEGRTFPAGTRLAIGVGAGKSETLTPASAASGIGIYGLTSVLPPGTTS
jgi:hypothetical protein